jgi:putative GTP pyrophosphokinase
MDYSVPEVTSAEREFYGENLILLEGAISEFLSCMDMIRRYEVQLGNRDPVTSSQTRIKSAESMRQKLQRLTFPVTAESAMKNVFDAAGVRLVCPFIQDIDRTAELIRAIPGVQIQTEKDYIRSPKPNGYRSYHMILSMPLRFLGNSQKTVWLEVQLRTIAMDCWANIEHQLKYKQNIPDQALLLQELKRCADEITSTDLSLQTIRDLIEHHEEEPI